MLHVGLEGARQEPADAPQDARGRRPALVEEVARRQQHGLDRREQVEEVGAGVLDRRHVFFSVAGARNSRVLAFRLHPRERRRQRHVQPQPHGEDRVQDPPQVRRLVRRRMLRLLHRRHAGRHPG